MEISIDKLGILSKKVTLTNGCWLWEGNDNGSGYARKWIDGKLTYLHRYSYQLYIGEIPTGLELDHLCRVRNCINPKHLEPVTRKENTLRGDSGRLAGARQRSKTHCPSGHEYSEENTYRLGTRRHCRICKYNSQKRIRTNSENLLSTY